MSMLNLAGIAVRADDGEVNIFKTDFDSYQVGTEEVVQQTLENLSNAYSVIRKDNDAAANIAGVKVDDEHGTSMEFNEAWQNVHVDLPVTCTANDKALVSFDFIAPNVGGANGYLKVLGNANNNFASQIQLRWDGTAINYWDGVSGDGVKLYESAIPANKWVKIEYYLDHTEKYYITYVEGKPISKHAMYGEKTPLASLQFQTAYDINADHKVYIDNLEVKKKRTK